MNILHQILIVFLILASLPLVITLLYKLHLFPLAMYFVATDFVFTQWSRNHPVLCGCLFVGGILYATLRWFCRIHTWKSELLYYEDYLLKSAIPLNEIKEDID